VAHQKESADLDYSVVITSAQHLGHEAFDAINWGTLIGTAISCLNEAWSHIVESLTHSWALLRVSLTVPVVVSIVLYVFSTINNGPNIKMEHTK